MTDFNFSSAKSFSDFNISSFLGVDFADSPFSVSPNRSPDSLNMMPDLNGSVSSRHGYEEVLNVGDRINGIYELKTNDQSYVIIHHGSKISRWEDHDMYKHIVPETQTSFHYQFTVGEQSHSFVYGVLSEDDECTYTASTNTLTINGQPCQLSDDIQGSLINFECVFYKITLPQKTSSFKIYFTSPFESKTSFCTKDYLPAELSEQEALYDVVNRQLIVEGITYSLVEGTAGTHVDLVPDIYQSCQIISRLVIKPEHFARKGYIIPIMFDSPMADETDYVYKIDVRIEYADVPPDGLEFIFYYKSKTLEFTRNGIKETANASLYPIKNISEALVVQGIWFDASNTELLFNYPENLYYNFNIEEQHYNFISQPLVLGTEIKFDTVTKSLYINDSKVGYSEGVVGGEQITMEKYQFPLINLDVEVPDQKSSCQQVNNKLYIFTGLWAYVFGKFDIFDSDGGVVDSIYTIKKMTEEAYIPTVVEMSEPITETGRTSNPNSWVESGGGGGQSFESFNLLSLLAKETFCVSSNGGYDSETGNSTRFRKLPLSTAPIDSVIKIEVCDDNGEWSVVDSSEYGVNTTTGVIQFNENLKTTALSLIKASPNYRVTYSLSNMGNRETENKYYSFSDGQKNGEYRPPEVTSYTDFTVPIYRFYLGNKIQNPSQIRVNLKFDESVSGYGYYYYGGSEYNIYKEDFKNIYLVVGLEEKVSTFLLPSGRPAYINLGKNKGRAGRLKVYTKVEREGNKLYLNISGVFYCQGYMYYSDTGKLYSGMDTGIYTPDNISIDAISIENFYQDRINKATISTKFGYGGNMDRLFVAGYYDMPEYEFWSEIDNPLYFPDLNYAALGDSDTSIMGWSRIDNNQMAVHKNFNGSDPTIYIQSASLNDDFSVNFPVKEGAAGVGVISQRAFGVLNGEPLALSSEGVFSTQLVTDVAADVKYAAPRSYFIDPFLRNLNLAQAEAIVFNNSYYLAVDGFVFFADGSQLRSVKSDIYSYEWFLWDNIPVNVWWIYQNQLYFGTADGCICKFNDSYMDIDKPVNCYWTTPPLFFGSTSYYKKIKNVIVSSVMPSTDFSEVYIDYISDYGVNNVKGALIDNTSHLGSIKSISTNYKLNKISSLQLRIRADNAEDFNISDISILYSLGSRFKA